MSFVFMSSTSSLSMMLCLPTEILEEILLSPALGVPDLCRMRQVCCPLHNIVSSLWTRVASTKWKGWGSISGSTHEEWYSLCRQRHCCEQQLATVLDHLSRRCYRLRLTDEDELAVFSTMLEKETFSRDTLLCVLSEILQTPSKSGNMTEQFYALYGKEYIVRQRLISEWKELLELPVSEQTMERGAILVAQWMRPCHCPEASIIVKQLDSIAEMVAVHLLESVGGEDCGLDVKRLRQSPLEKVVEKGLPVDAVLAALNTVLYDHLGFRGAGDSYYELGSSFIDLVLERKQGIPITLSAVYEAVARRLGVQLLPVNFPRHFILTVTTGSEAWPSSSDRVLIDAYSRGQRLSLDELLEREAIPPSLASSVDAAPVPPLQVYVRCLNNISYVVQRLNIERMFDVSTAQWLPIPLLSVLYLRVVLAPLAEPFSIPGRGEDTVRICNELQYNPQLICEKAPRLWKLLGKSQCSQIRFMTMLLQENLTERQKLVEPVTIPKRRPLTTNVKYSIGMIMKHRKYDYRCVIYGWDETCVMSEAWIAQMSVDRLPSGRHQPFYNVLAHDGSIRYASQENLMACPSEEMGPIPHWEVGKYFTQFIGTGYIPNAPLREAYPDDP